MSIYFNKIKIIKIIFFNFNFYFKAFWLIREFYYDNDDLEISLDHDAGKYADQGGDYIKILERLEEICYGNPNFRNYIRDKVIFHLHTANPVGRENMTRIIHKNGWREV